MLIRAQSCQLCATLGIERDADEEHFGGASGVVIGVAVADEDRAAMFTQSQRAMDRRRGRLERESAVAADDDPDQVGGAMGAEPSRDRA